MGKRIVIVGAGAVGAYIGGRLTQSGQDVTLVDPWPEHVEAIRRQGLSIAEMNQPEPDIVTPRTMHVTEVQGLKRETPVDIAIIACKSYDTAWSTALIAPYLAPNGFVVSAQNGINEETVAGVVGWGRTVGCMVGNNFAVDLIEPGYVIRTMPRGGSVANLQSGEVHGRVTPRVRELAEILSGVDASDVTPNIWGVRWSKLCVNGMRNGVSAATGLGGNARDAHDTIRKVVIRLAGEAVRVGHALGYELDPILKLEPSLFVRASDGEPAALQEVETSLIAGSRSSARSDRQRPSMAQDIAKGRRTEIDALNGLIARKGVEMGIPAPTHEALLRIVGQVERGEVVPRPELLLSLAG